ALVVTLATLFTACKEMGLTEAGPRKLDCPASSKAILVDATHDGGAWWFPQGGPFDATQPHQGKALADYLRARGFTVDELGRGVVIDSTRLLKYTHVVRAGNYGGYLPQEGAAYARLAQ